jgi:hypothetical protein
MSNIDGQKIRQTILEVVGEIATKNAGYFQSGYVLQETSRRLGLRGNDLEQALLTYWHDLFRTGYLAWGLDLANISPPFFHITDQGRRTLKNLSRDPANPDGYLAHLASVGKLNDIARSYLEEGLACFNAALYKAAAVMIGASAESIALELRDTLVQCLDKLSLTVPKELEDWRVKRVVDKLQSELEKKKKDMPRQLSESVESYWSAFAQQIRSSRNDAGHPSRIDPIKPETVHASLLIYPELVKLVSDLRDWINNSYS